MEQINFIIAAVICILLCYITYILQMRAGKSKPVFVTWFIWLLYFLLNSGTSYTMFTDNPLLALVSYISTVTVVGVTIFLFIKKRFGRFKWYHWGALLITVFAGVFWWVTKDELASSVILQGVIVISLIPMVVDLITNKAREEIWPWLFSVLAYAFIAIAVTLKEGYSWEELAYPIVNGVVGNGVILVITFIKRRQWDMLGI